MVPDEKNKDHMKQSEKFIEKARELESDEDEAAFEERLRKIAKPEKKEAPEK